MNIREINELLLCILRSDSDRRTLECFESLSESDWDEIIRQSMRHCITPLIFHRLMKVVQDVPVPDGIMSRLRDTSLYSAAKNMRFYHELDKLLLSLENRIPVVLMKGGHLAAFVYRDVSMRSMADLDILVRRTDVQTVEKALQQLGYTRNMTNPDHPYHVAYIDPSRSVEIEVHWNICSESAQSISVEIEELWKGAQSEVLRGCKILVWRPEHLLLHICLHDAGQHFYLVGLRTFCDIEAIIRRYRERIDWSQVVSRAKQWGIAKSSYLTLLLARELLGADVPAAVLSALKPQDSGVQTVSWARQAVFSPLGDDASASENFTQLWGTEMYTSKIALIWASLFPPREVMAKIYSVPPNSPGVYLHYFWRLIDLSVRYGRSVWKLSDENSELHISLEAEYSRILLRRWLET